MGIDWTVTVLTPILSVLIPIVITGLSILGGIWINRLRAKEAASEALLKDALSQSVAKQAVNAAEEVSAHQEKVTGTPMSSVEKQAYSTTFIQERIPDKTPEIIKGDIKASLGATPGIGASVTMEVKP